MTDMDPTPEQKRELIVQALGIAEFLRVGDMDIYTQEHGVKKTVVDLTAGTSVYFMENKQKVVLDDEYDTLAKVSKMITEAEDGRMPAITEANMVYSSRGQTATPEQPDDAQTEAEPVPTEPVNIPTVREPAQALVPSAPHDLSVQTIKKYINDKATDEEAYVFLQLCKARGLNPFVGDAYLIKYNHTKPATMVVGKDAFLKRAESHVQYDGFEAGIILESGDDYKVVDERDGTFYSKDEKENIVGGWAKVYRKDQTHPVVAKVAYSEYVGINGQTGRPNKTWDSKPATMIRKVALVQALREAFPSELSGMYDQSEMGVEVSS